jgi:hypothetical protein
MSEASFERELLWELREVVGNRKLKKDCWQEWSTSEEQINQGLRPDEKKVFLPTLRIWVAYKGGQ